MRKSTSTGMVSRDPAVRRDKPQVLGAKGAGMSKLRNITRNLKTPAYLPEVSNQIRAWARRSFEKKYGVRAAAMAALCRHQGLRDLVIPVGDVVACIPRLASMVFAGPLCQHGGMYENAGARSERCRQKAVLLTITDSGLELFLCEEHVEEHVVVLPT